MATRTFSVFITGSTGYLGTPLIRALVDRGHSVRALVRPGSEKKLPAGVTAVSGNPVGVSHPSPSKAAEFQAIDRASALGAIAAVAKPECGTSFI